MNCTYKIFYIVKNLKVSELKRGAKVGYSWKVDDLKNDYSFTKLIEDKNLIESFNRTQNWLKKNYPEYLI